VDATPARKLAPFFDVPAEPGLADVLEGSAELEAVIHTVGPTSSDENEDGPRLFVVPAGRPTLDAASMLASPRLDGVLDGLSGAADYVIVVGPSVNSADVLPVAAAADEAILVAQPGRTTRADAKAARDVLDRVAASGRSVVFARGRRLPSLR
jgi:Mrp family chromosome partitioning ATPase